MARILLLDTHDCFDALRNVLESLGHAVISGQSTVLASLDAVFCSGDDPDCKLIVKSLNTLRPSLPVVVVTAKPECIRWLEALEAGAANYCSSPFSAAQLGFILESLPNIARVYSASGLVHSNVFAPNRTPGRYTANSAKQ
jgi:DNA-binding NtrC family response regulator